jgi:hypothetical protein
MIILSVRGFINFTSLVLDTIVGFIQRKRNKGQRVCLNWILDDKRQLQRMVCADCHNNTSLGAKENRD